MFRQIILSVRKYVHHDGHVCWARSRTLFKCNQYHFLTSASLGAWKRPTDQPTNQPINRPTNQPTNRPTNQPTDGQTGSKRDFTFNKTFSCGLCWNLIRIDIRGDYRTEMLRILKWFCNTVKIECTFTSEFLKRWHDTQDIAHLVYCEGSQYFQVLFYRFYIHCEGI